MNVSVASSGYSQVSQSDADFAVTLGDQLLQGLATDGYLFLKLESDALHGNIIAVNVGGTQFVIPSTNPELFFPYPMNIGDVFSDTAVYELSLGDTSVKHIVHKTIKIDAFGTMELSQGSFDVLRMYEENISFDTLWISLTPGLPAIPIYQGSDTSYRYNFLTNSDTMRHPIVNITLDELGAVKYTNWIWDGTFPTPPTPGSIEDIDNSLIAFSCFPNPTKDMLNISVSERTKKGHFSIFNVAGQHCKSIQASKENIAIDVSELSKGQYFIFLYEEDQVVGKNTFQVK